jgi:hypothetical protein
MPSRAAHIVGLTVPPGSPNLEIKPYVIANASARSAPAGLTHDLAGDVGGDVKVNRLLRF